MHTAIFGASAGNMGALLSDKVDAACLLPRAESPRLRPAPGNHRERVGRETCPFNKVRLAVGHDWLGAIRHST